MAVLCRRYLPRYLFSVSNLSHISAKIGRYLSCAQRTVHGKDLELILMVKIETTHPVEGQFGSEFPPICNQCVFMTALSRKTWKF